MRIPPDPERGQRLWLALGRFLGWWTLGVMGLVLAAFILLLILHFTGIIELADS